MVKGYGLSGCLFGGTTLLSLYRQAGLCYNNAIPHPAGDGTRRNLMYQPLADRIRPTELDDVVGQRHILGENGILRRIIESGHIPNMAALDDAAQDAASSRAAISPI